MYEDKTWCTMVNALFAQVKKRYVMSRYTMGDSNIGGSCIMNIKLMSSINFEICIMTKKICFITSPFD